MKKILFLILISSGAFAQVQLLTPGDDITTALSKINKSIDNTIVSKGDAIFIADYGLALNGTTDDSQKIQSAIDDAASGSVVVFPAGASIKISNTVYINKKITLKGNYVSIVMDANLPAFYLFEKDECVMTEFVFTGSGRNVSAKTSQVAILYAGGSRHQISNIRCDYVSGVGIQGANNFGESSTLQQQGTSLNNIVLWQNNIGIAWMGRSEYNVATNIVAYENLIAIQDNSGNNVLNGFSMQGNFTGYKMLSGANVGHGSISNGSFNHHTTYGLDIDAAGTGVLINTVNFFQAYNYVRNASKGVKFSNCQFDGLTTYAIEFSGSTSVHNSVDNCQWSNAATDPKTKIIGSSSAKFTVRNLRRIDGQVFNFGSLATTILAAKTTNYTVLSSDFDHTLQGDATAGNITFSLLSAVGMDGLRITVMKSDASANYVVIDPNGSETVNGSSSNINLTTQWEFIELESNGANWIKINKVYPLGDVVGPASSVTDNAIVRFDLTTGKIIQESSANINDSGVISAAGFTSTGPFKIIATNTTFETIVSNYGTMGASSTGSNSINVNAYYSNNTTLIADITVYGIKSDGSGSVVGKVTGRYRKNSSGTFSVDDAGTTITSDATILTSIVPEINGTNPQVQVNTGVAATGYAFSFTAVCSYITY